MKGSNKDYSKCPNCGHRIYIIKGDSSEGWYRCYEASEDLEEGEEIEIDEGSRLDRADEVDNVTHYTCDVRLFKSISDQSSARPCGEVYCTSKDELINMITKN